MDLRVLVVEDGTEYIDTLGRFLAQGFAWSRAGSGPEALALLAHPGADVVFLDMRFDRTPEAQLLGDRQAAARRFNGDAVQARRYLEDHQGNFILAAIRAAGHDTPVLLSHDFTSEPRRWAKLSTRYAPVDFLIDVASPSEVAERLRSLGGRSDGGPTTLG
ncbi:MAG: hypothetical protein KTR31_35585 [Myxococcales bacterium]|nr:hypothetical protein [Myxococcales bacterium]